MSSRARWSQRVRGSLCGFQEAAASHQHLYQQPRGGHRGARQRGTPSDPMMSPWAGMSGEPLDGALRDLSEGRRERVGVGRATYTQVPGVQLHLLLQLSEQLVVKGLQLEREHTPESTQTCRRGAHSRAGKEAGSCSWDRREGNPRGKRSHRIPKLMPLQRQGGPAGPGGSGRSWTAARASDPLTV